jgi:SAM-dependent methyltransferase
MAQPCSLNRLMTSYWHELEHHTDLTPIWMAHPAVRAVINTRVTGDPDLWPLFALKRWLGKRAPITTGLSIGCGTGGLERALIGEGIARAMTGIDMSDAAITEARQLSNDPAIDYVCGDARAYLAAHMGRFDAVFFHQSLHHFDRLDELMDLAAGALRPDGFLYIDEYIGPSRDEWTWWKLILPNLAYRLVPGNARRPHLVRAPINNEDPTEAIQSSRIERAISNRFLIADRRDYGGNLLSIVYPNLEQKSRDDFDVAVRRLIRFEDVLLRYARPFYTTIIAEPR